MPFTVTCPACASPFTLGDDLSYGKVVGNLMKLKCQHCAAEIAVDVTQLTPPPTHTAPRRGPAPPRRKVTQLGLGPAPAAARLVPKSATATPTLCNCLHLPRGCW